MQQEQSPPEIVEPEESGPFSPAIMKLAQTNDLGQPQQEYLATFPLDPHGSAISLTIAIWLLTIPLIFVVPLVVQKDATFWTIVWVTVALLLTLLIWTITFLLQRHRKATHYQRVYVCSSGLLCQKLNTFEVVHWHHIETVNYDTVGNSQVHDNDGAIFPFSSPLQQLGDLCHRIEQAIIPYRLPPLLTSYREGLPLLFGPLRINQQGIGLTQKNVILFAWDKIQGIERRFDSLFLKLYNNRTVGLPLTAHEIPRINLAQALIRDILKASEEDTQELPDLDKPEEQRGRGTQKDQVARSLAVGTPVLAPTSDGVLTTIMGDPIETATSDKLSVIVYEQGFLYLNKANKKLDITRWDQISQVIRRTHNNNGLIEYTIKVTRNDETTFVFPHTQPLIAGIGLYVEQKAAEWALPPLLQQYDADETTAFGKLTINQTGITYNKRTLPWSEVYELRILQLNSTHISIKQRGTNRQWQSIAINKIPDVYLLKLLIDHIISTHPAIQR
jgi:hypothetical protein